MAEPVREELSALAAIFCGPDEWEVLSRSESLPPSQRAEVFPNQPHHAIEDQKSQRTLDIGQGLSGQLTRLWGLLPGPLLHPLPWEEQVLENGDIFKFPGLRLLSSNSETDGTVFRILTKAEGHSDVDIPIELVFHLPVNYPVCLPGLSVHSEHLTRAQCVTVKEKLLEQAQNLLLEPMVHELVLWLQQNLRHLLDQPETRNGSEKCALATDVTVDDGLWITLLHLDHMRAKTKYVRTVERWASDLKLTGRLMFMGKIILILLQGDRNSIKEYLILQKTSKVDVDSSGKKCKEKMISVLFETKVQTEHKRFLAFEVKEYSSLDELQKEFETAGLKKLFSEFVFGLVK